MLKKLHQYLYEFQGDAQEVEQQSALLRERCMLAEKRQEDLKYRLHILNFHIK